MARALQIVLDLARQNLAPEDMEAVRKEQEAACAMVEDLAVNEYGDA